MGIISKVSKQVKGIEEVFRVLPAYQEKSDEKKKNVLALLLKWVASEVEGLYEQKPNE